MDCESTQRLLHGYADGEIDLAGSLEIEAHLESCAVCSRMQQDLLTFREKFNSGNLYFAAPPGLERRIRTALPRQRRALWLSAPVRWLAVAASAALVAVVVWRPAPRAGGNELAREVVSSHVRSLMPGHLTDVLSSDQHTVKPWFTGKLDFSPAVKDLASEGFPLAGGRLDYIGGRPVAALVYQRRKHVINVFIWPSAQESAIVGSVYNGYNVMRWSRAGMAYWAVSDVNRAELETLARLFGGE